MANITDALIRCAFGCRKSQEDANVDLRTASPAYLSLLASSGTCFTYIFVG